MCGRCICIGGKEDAAETGSFFGQGSTARSSVATTGCKGWPVLKGGPRSSQHLCRPGAPVGAEISSVKVHRCSDPSSFFGRCPIHWSWFPASASARVAQRRCSTVLNLISSSRRHPKGLCRSGHQSIVARMLAADLSSLAAACASVCECCWCVCV